MPWLIRSTDPAVAAAEIASEHRKGADYVRVTVALAVAAADVADALTIAWDAFTDAAAADLTGWQLTAAAAEVQPGSLNRPDPDRVSQPSSGHRPVS